MGALKYSNVYSPAHASLTSGGIQRESLLIRALLARSLRKSEHSNGGLNSAVVTVPWLTGSLFAKSRREVSGFRVRLVKSGGVIIRDTGSLFIYLESTGRYLQIWGRKMSSSRILIHYMQNQDGVK